MPEQTLIVRTDNDVVAAGVDVKGGDPASARCECFRELGFAEIVDTYVTLGRDKEHGFRGVEFDFLHDAAGFAEWVLRGVAR